jgi:hypothetical protein
MVQIKKCEGVLGNVIVVVNAGMDGSQQLGRQGRRVRGGAPGPRQRLAGVRCYQRSSPPNSTRFSPTASWRRRELDSLTLGWQQMVVAAGNGEAVRLASGVDAEKLWCSTGENEGTKGGGDIG